MESKILLAGDVAPRDGIAVTPNDNPDVVTVGFPEVQLTSETYQETRQRIADNALAAASNLSLYSAEQLAGTTAWVVNMHADANASAARLAAELNATAFTPTQVIDHTYYYEAANDVPVDVVISWLNANESVRYFYPLVNHGNGPRAVPDDEFFSDQWHLQNTGQSGGTAGDDVNILNVWDQYRGTGVTIGVVDDGLQHTHPDLSTNYDATLALDVVDGDNDPTPGSAFDGHGTSAAGVAAGTGFNGMGISGAAPDATLTGIRLLDFSQTDQTQSTALSHRNDAIDIYNNSWGPPDNSGVLATIEPLSVMAIFDSATNGRGGLGNLHMWAAGNGLQGDDNVNQDHLANSPYSIAITALDHNGTQASYAEPGAPIVVGTYSNTFDANFNTVGGIVTTDLVGTEGYNSVVDASDNDPHPDLDYTADFGGTSSATPLASGIVALMLEANPGLTYRDVTQILIDTAVQNDSSDTSWSVNSAGYNVSEKYGFGSIDAEAAVLAAESWITVQPVQLLTTGTIQAASTPIPDDQQTALNATITIADQGADFALEYVEIVLDTTHAYSTDLAINLISPAGTVSELNQGNLQFFPPPDYDNWTMTSTHFWGEDFVGDWTLQLFDRVNQDAGTLESFELIFHSVEQGESFLRGVKFADVNSNGVRDFGEPGLPDWTVYLDSNDNGQLDSGEPTTTTNQQGVYSFGVNAGDYVIREVAQENWSQVAPTGDGAHRVTVTSGEILSDLDFANHPDPGTVSGVVWNDINNNGIRDNEPGLERITLFLDRNADGIQDPNEETTMSRVDGSYSFDNASYGEAVVTQVLPTGINQTFPASGNGQSVFIDAGGSVSGINFGNHFDPGTVAGFVWRDIDGDSIRDPGEHGMSQILVYLDTNGDDQLSLSEPSTRTNSIGRYEFSSVQPGEYSVRVAPMLGFAQSFPLDNEGYNLTVMPDDLLVGNSFGLRGFAADFGDAPFPYPTRFTNNGAAHEFVPGPVLGSVVSPDLNGQPSDDALADDDDGVTILTAFEAGEQASMEIVASVPGRVSAWIDFDRNGIWDPTAELVLNGQQVGTTPTTFTINVPVTAVAGTSYARFRISTGQNLLPTGVAPDGEVEDYAVTLINNIPAPDDPLVTDPDDGSGDDPVTSNPYTNTANRFDVDNNGSVTITDAIVIVADLIQHGIRELATPAGAVTRFIDTNGDNRATLNDALEVVRALVIARNAGAGEGEAASVASADKTAAPIESRKNASVEVIGDATVGSNHDQALLAETAMATNDEVATAVPSDELEESVSLIADDLQASELL